MTMELFTQYGSINTRAKSGLSLRKSKILYINNKLAEIYNPNNHEYANIYFDKKEFQIGIDFIKYDVAGVARKVAITYNGTTLNLNSVINSFGIRELKGKIDIDIIDGKEILIFSIAKLLEK